MPTRQETRAGLDARLLVTTTVQIGARDWQVTAVQNQDALLDAADELEHFPYGYLLWEAAIGLARFLAANPALVAGKRVLELGAGVGLPGMIAQALGAQVWQTDHQAGALALAEQNAAQNGIVGLRRFTADWRSWTHAERYDVLLGSDILYERAMHFYLESIFRENLLPDGALILADPGRPQALEFAARLEKAGRRIRLETERVPAVEGSRDTRPVEVAVLTVRMRDEG